MTRTSTSTQSPIVVSGELDYAPGDVGLSARTGEPVAQVSIRGRQMLTSDHGPVGEVLSHLRAGRPVAVELDARSERIRAAAYIERRWVTGYDDAVMGVLVVTEQGDVRWTAYPEIGPEHLTPLISAACIAQATRDLRIAGPTALG